MDSKQVVIVGGGPAGLTAAYQLVKLGQPVVVVEKHRIVGGLARTEDYKGFCFDIGGHRFFTKVEEVDRMWREILGEDFLRRPRLSRIYYNRRFFYYPLRPVNALIGLGLWKSLLIVFSYLKWQILPHPREETFEQWVTNRFGRRLFLTFFKTYTEKVWGIPCSELRAEWAAQRIRGLSLKTALLSMFLKPNRTIKTLIDEFYYPRLGPGMMWERVKDEIERNGGAVKLNSEVVSIQREGDGIRRIVVSNSGQREVIEGSTVISSIPIGEFLKKLDPPPPPRVLDAAERLRYRDLLVVCLIVRRPCLFPDNWIYIHEPEVKVGRIQNYKNWSPDMVPDSSKTSLGLEYFCTRGDDLWSMSDTELLALGKRELAHIGLARETDVEDGCVLRIPHAYPVYDADYRANLALVRGFVEGLRNFQTIGRNGLHRYNNQDHAMLTGMMAARNLVLGERNDLWSVNTDQEYHEEALIDGKALEEAFSRVFLRLDRTAFGVAAGLVSGLLLFLVTLEVVIKGGEAIGPTLQLLRYYFPGYTVSPAGSVVGLFYGLATGYIGGWLFAFARNAAMFLYLTRAYRKAQRGLLRRFFDYT
jgi:protoporphyrinogen oxidase